MPQDRDNTDRCFKNRRYHNGLLHSPLSARDAPPDRQNDRRRRRGDCVPPPAAIPMSERVCLLPSATPKLSFRTREEFRTPLGVRKSPRNEPAMSCLRRKASRMRWFGSGQLGLGSERATLGRTAVRQANWVSRGVGRDRDPAAGCAGLRRAQAAARGLAGTTTGSQDRRRRPRRSWRSAPAKPR
jgi:hypothetical protein